MRASEACMDLGRQDEAVNRFILSCSTWIFFSGTTNKQQEKENREQFLSSIIYREMGYPESSRWCQILR